MLLMAAEAVGIARYDDKLKRVFRSEKMDDCTVAQQFLVPRAAQLKGEGSGNETKKSNSTHFSTSVPR